VNRSMTDTAQVAEVQGAAGNRVEAPPAATLREYIESLLVTVIPGAVRHNIYCPSLQDSVPIDGADAIGGRPPACEQVHLRRAWPLVRPFLAVPGVRRATSSFSSFRTKTPALRQARDRHSR